MKESGWDLARRVGGLPGWAFCVVEEIKRGPAWVLYKLYPFDCDGKPISKPGDYRYLNTWPPVNAKNIDFRTLKDLQAGCCPPQLMMEFIETERLEAGKTDAVEEAMTLHKQGYLSGAG